MPAADYVLITIDQPDVYDAPIVENVGTVYEVGIAGVGYMLADHPERNLAYQRGTIDLETPRLATSDTPFSQAIERYSFAVHETFIAGAGQEYLHRDGSTSRAYLDSEGLDPFTEPGTLKLLPDTTKVNSSTYTGQNAVVVDRTMYHQVGDAALDYGTNGTGWTSLTGISDATGTVTISDLTTDGQYWYAATGRSVIRGTTSSPGADWSTYDAVEVKWAAGRLISACKNGSSSTPNQVMVHLADGTDEVQSGGTAGTGLQIFDEGQTVTLGGAAAGAFYFGVYAGSTGQVYSWKLGLDQAGNYNTPFVAWELPAGYIPVAVDTAGDSVWVVAYQPEGASSGRAVLYRGIPNSDGSLTPFLTAELDDRGTTTDWSTVKFSSFGDMVFFSWPDMGTYSGIGAVYLPTGGYAKWLAGGATGDVTAVLPWQGRMAFAIDGDGLYWEDTDAWVTSGTWYSSIWDGGSALDKVWDVVTLVTKPLDVGEAIDVDYSVNGGGSWHDLASTDTDGGIEHRIGMSVKAATMVLRLNVTGDGTSATQINMVQARMHPLGLTDTILVLPISCADNLTGLNGHPLPDNGPGAGALRARTLQQLAHTRVKVQDVDWPWTDETHIYEVIDTQTNIVGIYDRSLPGKRYEMVVTLRLRKAGVG